MVSPTFCSNCGRPLAGAEACTVCASDAPLASEGLVPPVPAATVATADDVPDSSVPPFASRALPSAGPGSGYGSGSATAGTFAYGSATTGAPDLSRYSSMWNWGAFFLCPFWLMNHGAVPLGIVALVLSFVPLVNTVSSLGFGIYFGIKGNDWAASHRAFASDAQFVAVQNAWRNWGIGLALLGTVFAFAAIVLVGMAHALSHAVR